MRDYKQTLNLPKTDFPMKGNLSQREPEMLQRWRDTDLYGRIRKHNAGKPKFILHDGPPYANGEIHLGHALNKILKDIIIKSRTLGGYDAPYVPGWDCHGLPIELQVEKKVGRAGHKLDAHAFRDACRDYAQKQIESQRADFIRLGVFGDWDNPYLTMDFTTEADIVRALGRMIGAGHLLKGFKPVHWCLDCGSALAEAEVEYEDKISPQIDVRFRVTDLEELNRRFGTDGNRLASILIWTTTPWTLPANQAVALHPEYDYVLIDDGEERLIVCKELLGGVMQRYGIEKYEVNGTVKGAILEGLDLQHPFNDRQVPVILGQHVTMETGTGAVHTAPGHGHDDYVIGQQYGLPVVSPVDGRGVFSADTPVVGGKHVNEANNHLIEVMRENGSLMLVGKLHHSYPHCWRHKTPIIFRATPQWFFSMDARGLREKALGEIGKIKWIPDWGQRRIRGMVAERADWCISRQRTWGVPIAVFIHRETGELHPRTTGLTEQIAILIEETGIDAWFNLDPEDILGGEHEDYEKVMDILDVWFDSGVTHATVLRKNPGLAFPADIYLEGSDQHRGWFQSSLLTSVGISGVAPYRSVLTHGFTVDEKGVKMSKSRGNAIAPQKIIKTLGADMLRLWVAATDYRAEMSLSEEILKRTADAYRRIRNTARYLLANLNGFDPAKDIVDGSRLLELDKWILKQAVQLQDELIEAYNSYRFHLIYQKLHHFCTVTLSSLYLDIIKDRIYTMKEDSQPRRSAQTAMYHIAEAFVRWLAPVLSFTADEIWQYLPGKRDDSVFLEGWYDRFPEISAWANEDWQNIIAVRDEVSKELERLRVAGRIGSALDAEVQVFCNGALKSSLDKLEDELRFVFITSYADVGSDSSRGDDAVASGIENLWIKVLPSGHKKCIRCWHHREDVGANTAHPELCDRCAENVDGKGEHRHYA